MATKATRIKLRCNECQKAFTCGPNADPICPKCGGADWKERAALRAELDEARLEASNLDMWLRDVTERKTQCFAELASAREQLDAARATVALFDRENATLTAKVKTLDPVGTCVKCKLSVRPVDGYVQDERGMLHASCALLLRIEALTAENEALKAKVQRDSPPTDYSLLPLLGTVKKGPSHD